MKLSPAMVAPILTIPVRISGTRYGAVVLGFAGTGKSSGATCVSYAGIEESCAAICVEEPPLVKLPGTERRSGGIDVRFCGIEEISERTEQSSITTAGGTRGVMDAGVPTRGGMVGTGIRMRTRAGGGAIASSLAPGVSKASCRFPHCVIEASSDESSFRGGDR